MKSFLPKHRLASASENARQIKISHCLGSKEEDWTLEDEKTSDFLTSCTQRDRKYTFIVIIY